jgi:hypothetical protein
MTRTRVVYICRECRSLPIEVISERVELASEAQVDRIINEALEKGTVPDQCQWCGGPADMLHVRNNEVFATCKRCRLNRAEKGTPQGRAKRKMRKAGAR